MIRPLTISLGILLSASNTGLAADCTTIWREMDATYSTRLLQNFGKSLDPSAQLRTNSRLPLSTPISIYIEDPKAPQSLFYKDTLDQIAKEVPFVYELTPTPDEATIGVGVVDDDGIGSEDFHLALESIQPDPEARSELLTAMIEGSQIRYTERLVAYHTSERSPPPPARRFVAIGTAYLPNIRTIAAISVIGTQYLEYAKACKGYQGVFLFNSLFDKIQEDDFNLIRHAYSLYPEENLSIER